jgi:ribosomal protein S18 acetylase RimI-like enzyme
MATAPSAGAELAVKIHPLTPEMVHAVAQLHMLAFKGSMNTRLGRAYVEAFVSWFQAQPDAVALAALDNDGSVLGYVVGAPVGYAKSMNRDLCWVAVRGMVSKPALLLDSRLWVTVAARVRALASAAVPVTPGLPPPTVSLVSIAVSPAASGRHVGRALMRAFEDRARAMRMASGQLSVYPENQIARRLYEACGWRILGAASATGTIYYGRML